MQLRTEELTWKKSARLHAMVATLLREGPPPRDSRKPIKHKLKVKLGLRLKKCEVDRVRWAVACCAYFEGMRIGDLLRQERGDVV